MSAVCVYALHDRYCLLVPAARYLVRSERCQYAANMQGTVVVVALSVFNAIFVLAGVSTAVEMWYDCRSRTFVIEFVGTDCCAW